jgi:hypothetical protein
MAAEEPARSRGEIAKKKIMEVTLKPKPVYSFGVEMQDSTHAIDCRRSKLSCGAALIGPAPIVESIRGPLHHGESMGFALWMDAENGTAWAQGTHEYRPMGAAVIASTDQFRHRDFRQARRRPASLRNSFAGFFGSLEEVNVHLRGSARRKLRSTPAHLL